MKSSEKLEVVQKKLGDITPYANNPRNNDDAVEAVAASIREFGFQQPIVTDKDGVVIVGHTRLKAAEMLGLETVPVVVADLDEDKANAYRLADNKSGEIATWDVEMLDLELDGIGIDMSPFGFVTAEVEDEIEITIDDFTEEVPPRAQGGSVWQLGEHRLICGDATDGSVIERLMNGHQADLVITDPPYNVNYGDKAEYLDKYLNKGHRNKSHIKNDDMDSVSFYYFLFDSFSRAFDAAKAGAAVYIFHSENEGINFRTAFVDAGWKLSQCLIWNKNTFVLGRNDYQWKHEPILYGWKEGASHYFIDDRKQSTVIEDGVSDFSKMKKDEMRELLEEIYSDHISTTIINESKPIMNDLHPTMKPLKLIARLIQNSSKKGWIVLDMFGGSGSTLIACEQLNRKCYMCELDPHYCDVIINRWEQLTGEKARLITE